MTSQQKDQALALANKLSASALDLIKCKDVELLSLKASVLNEARANYEEFIINAKKEQNETSK